jgi:hypothetical protein
MVGVIAFKKFHAVAHRSALLAGLADVGTNLKPLW